MDENQFRKEYIDRVWRDLDDRTKRWSQIDPASYTASLPEPLWDYIGEAMRMFTDGHFMGAVLVSAAVLEVVLEDQMKKRLSNTGSTIKGKGLGTKINRAFEIGVIGEPEKSEFKKLNDLRNDLIHADVDKLSRRGPQMLDSADMPIITPTFYLNSFRGVGIEEDTAGFIKAVRDLTVKFYGEKSVE